MKTWAELAAMETAKAFRKAAQKVSKDLGTYEKEWEKGWLIAEPEAEPGEGWQTGFEGIVTQPMRPLIGEVPEFVSVQPLSKAGSFPTSRESLGSKTTMHNTVNIYPQKLDDYTIHQAGEKLFNEIDRQTKRRGY